MAKKWYKSSGFRECGHSWFDAGFRKVAETAKYILGGREYGRRQNTRSQSLTEKVKKRGILQSLLRARKTFPGDF